MKTSMKRHLLLLSLVFAVSLAACGGGGSDPVTTPPPQQNTFVVPDGTFALTATLSVDHCSRTDDWNGNYDVAFDGTNFTMGQFVGTWTASSRLAKGEGPKSVHMVRSCTVTDQALCYLTFSDKNNFHGSIIYRHSIKGDCTGLVGCSTTWTVVGTRVTTP